MKLPLFISVSLVSLVISIIIVRLIDFDRWANNYVLYIIAYTEDINDLRVNLPELKNLIGALAQKTNKKLKDPQRYEVIKIKQSKIKIITGNDYIDLDIDFYSETIEESLEVISEIKDELKGRFSLTETAKNSYQVDCELKEEQTQRIVPLVFEIYIKSGDQYPVREWILVAWLAAVIYFIIFILNFTVKACVDYYHSNQKQV